MRSFRTPTWGLSAPGLLGLLAVGLGACGQGTTDQTSAEAAAPPMHIAPTVVPTKMGFQSVWGSSGTDVWAVGDAGTVAHFDGKVWTLVMPGVTENLTCVHGSGPDDVWVTGADGDLLHWNGTAWKIDMTLNGTTLLGVWAMSPTNVWVVGVDESDGIGSAALFGHWTGAWDYLDINGAATLWKIWASGPTDLWMVGTTANDEGGVYRGNGSIFNPMTFTSDSSVHSIWGSGPDDVWVAPEVGALQHWNGSGWTTLPMLMAGQSLFGISGSARDDIWTVGQNGVVAHYGSASTWSLSPVGTKATLFSVWSDNPDEAWLVGGIGTILRWDGTTWL
jgi:hypothetical protein